MICRSILLVFVFFSCLACTREDRGSISESYAGLSLKELEKHLEGIDVELESLARLSYRGGIGNVGYRSQPHLTAKNNEWIRIDFSKTESIDQIVLVPTIWRDTKKGFQADGFPKEFTLLAGSKDDAVGKVIARYGAENPVDTLRVAPLVIDVQGIEADWIKFDATELTAREWDGKFILQIFEIMAFSGQKNVALHQAVSISSPQRHEGGGRKMSFVVDGFVPYIMDASHGPQSLAFLSNVGIGDQPELELDMGESFPLSQIHLHAIDISDTVPQVTANDYALPRKLRIDGANQADFSDAVTLVDFQVEDIYTTGPNFIWNLPETSHRYIRLVAEEPFVRDGQGPTGSQIGFAEIAIYSEDTNVALGKRVKASFEVISRERSIDALTDGRNLYGDILPVRRWMNELERRHRLETERPRVIKELGVRYDHQQDRLKLFTWLAAVLALGMVITFLVMRIIRMRQIALIRERLAADLHDELGADIHTIGLLSDLAASTTNDTEELTTLHRRIRSETERSATAVRHCTNMLDADGLYADLREDMERASRRIMAKLDHSITITGDEYLRKLKPRTRVDLFLFYKESLVNISRHSGATKYRSRLVANAKQIKLIVRDNGRGLDDGEESMPRSLIRRAKFLGGKVSVTQPSGGGTRISLIVSTRRWFLFRK